MSRVLIQATWDDSPHLSGEQKESLWSSIPPHERDARTKGVPSLGSGRIYPIAEEDIAVDPFNIPAYWPRAYGFDADWNNTAAMFGAWDRDSDIVYFYSEHFQRQQAPAVHASAILARGEWLTGAMDPSTHGKINSTDGKRLSDEYRKLNLRLVDADNAVEAGIFACYQRMTRGGLKVFRTCGNWFKEFRIYRRDENGKVVKENDHLMDAGRYLIMTGMRYAAIDPGELDEMEREAMPSGRDKNAGY
jgi:hypothetical protein